MFDLALLCIAENKRSDPDSTSVADEFSNAGIILTICCFFLIVWIAWYVFICMSACICTISVGPFILVNLSQTSCSILFPHYVVILVSSFLFYLLICPNIFFSLKIDSEKLILLLLWG